MDPAVPSGADAARAPASWLRPAAALALVWTFVLGSLGVFLPFFGLYLRENAGLSGAEIGVVFASLPLAGILTQPLWGVVADRTGLRARMLVVLTLGAAAGYVLLGRARGFAEILGATVVLAAFGRSLVPLTVAATLAAFPAHRHAFGWIRVWGTLGFLAAVVSFPGLLDRWQQAHGLAAGSRGVSEPGLELMFTVSAGLLLGAAAAAAAVPNRGALAVRAAPGAWRRLLRHRPFRRALAVGFVAYLALHGPMDLFPVWVRAHGGDLDRVRNLWVIMLLPEIVLVTFLGEGLARLGPRGLLGLGIGAGGVRWLVCGLAAGTAAIHAVQALHAVVVVALILGLPLYVERTVPPDLRATGQALLAMLGVGLGAMASNLVAGALLDGAGADAPYVAGGVLALALAAALRWILPPPRPPDWREATTGGERASGGPEGRVSRGRAGRGG